MIPVAMTPDTANPTPDRRAARDRAARRKRRVFIKHKGFTLLELMIVLAVVAILTLLAYPAYTSHLIKTRRVAAAACLTEIAGLMESDYARELRYTSYGQPAHPLPTLGCMHETHRYYRYTFVVPDVGSTFTIRATPVPGSSQAKDTGCGYLSLTNAGVKGAEKAKNSAETLACWQVQ